jgi:hypothetical protein
MRRGSQKGSLKVFRGNHVAQWRENGHRRNRVLGPVSKMTKSQARAGLAAIVALVNNRVQVAHPRVVRSVSSSNRFSFLCINESGKGQPS